MAITCKVKHRYSAEENGMETLAIACMTDESKDLAAVLQVVRDEEGGYYYGIFCDFCTPDTLADRNLFLKFLEENVDNGYSCGSFSSVDEINAELIKDGTTAYGLISADEI